MGKFQRGQTIVEFALILPLFILIFFSIIYASLIFTDYMSLDNTARNIAHEASLCTDDSQFPAVVQKYTSTTTLVSDLYIWQPTSSGANNKYLSVKYIPASSQVQVDLQADYNVDGSALARTMRLLLSAEVGTDVSIQTKIFSKRD